MNPPKSNNRDGRRLSFYENYYDQSGRLLYVSDDENAEVSEKETVINESVKHSELLRADLKQRKNNNLSEQISVSDKLNYCQRRFIKQTEVKKTERHLWRQNRMLLFSFWFPIWLLLALFGVFSLCLFYFWNNDSVKNFLGITNHFKLVTWSVGYGNLGLFVILSFYLVLRKSIFSDDHRYLNNYSKFRHIIKFVLLFSSLLVTVAVSLLIHLAIPANQKNLVLILWILKIVAATIFFIISLILIIMKFLYRKKTLAIDIEEYDLDLVDLKIKY